MRGLASPHPFLGAICGMCSAGFTGDDVPRFPVQVEWQGSQRAVGGFTVLGQDHQGDCDCEEVLPRAVPLFALGGVGFGSLPNLDTKLSIYGLCLPSERGCVELSCGGGFLLLVVLTIRFGTW